MDSSPERFMKVETVKVDWMWTFADPLEFNCRLRLKEWFLPHASPLPSPKAR